MKASELALDVDGADGEQTNEASFLDKLRRHKELAVTAGAGAEESGIREVYGSSSETEELQFAEMPKEKRPAQIRTSPGQLQPSELTAQPQMDLKVVEDGTNPHGSQAQHSLLGSSSFASHAITPITPASRTNKTANSISPNANQVAGRLGFRAETKVLAEPVSLALRNAKKSSSVAQSPAGVKMTK